MLRPASEQVRSVSSCGVTHCAQTRCGRACFLHPIRTVANATPLDDSQSRATAAQFVAPTFSTESDPFQPSTGQYHIFVDKVTCTECSKVAKMMR